MRCWTGLAGKRSSDWISWKPIPTAGMLTLVACATKATQRYTDIKGIWNIDRK
jgi:hypothetical protein